MQEGRRPLHYGVFLGAGGLMTIIAGFSLIASRDVNQAAMQLFLGVGLLFVLIGVIKLIMRLVSSASDNEKKLRNKMSGVDEIDREEARMARESRKANTQAQKTSIIVCPHCQTRNYSVSNFCHMCGARLR